MAGINAARSILGEPPIQAPPETAHGALISHLMNANAKHFQPMNVNYGLFPPLPPRPGKKLRKREKNALLAERALDALGAYQRAVAAEIA
jgi:methylenetetrahydrofolate--tRNA-(uracil-5-)-methyltransferase